jgi:hypothetical protein
MGLVANRGSGVSLHVPVTDETPDGAAHAPKINAMGMKFGRRKRCFRFHEVLPGNAELKRLLASSGDFEWWSSGMNGSDGLDVGEDLADDETLEAAKGTLHAKATGYTVRNALL